MTLIAPVLQGFFTERLIGQRNASAHTVAAYRDTFAAVAALCAASIAVSLLRPARAHTVAT